MKRIQTKLLVIILLLFSVTLGVVFLLNHSFSLKALKENSNHQATELTVQTAKMFDIWIEARKNEIASLAQNPIAKLVDVEMPEEDIDMQIEFLKKQKEVYNKDYDIFFIAKADGSYHTTSGRASANLKDRAYWPLVMQGQVVASDPVVSKSTGKVVSVIIAPIRDDSGNIIGAMAGNVLIDNIRSLVSTDRSYSFMVNSEGLIIIHDDPEIARTLNLTDLEIKNNGTEDEAVKKKNELLQKLDLSPEQREMLSQLGKKMIGVQDKFKENLQNLKAEKIYLDKNYWHEYEFKGKKLRAVFLPINLGKWTVAVSTPLSIIDEKADQQSKANVIIFLISMTVITAVVVVFVGSITKPINQLNTAVEKIADGDLTKNINIKSKDEIGNLGNNINKMIAHLRSMVHNINKSAGAVALFSQQLHSTVGQTSDSIQEITKDISTINEEVVKSSKIMHYASSIVSEVSQSAYHIAQSCSEANDKSGVTVGSAVQGGQALQEAEESMKNMMDSMENISAAINMLSESSKRINDIVEVISTISDQTNLLALNAAIEAARAGENGRGFAVVAEEIRKLAEQSNLSTNEIKGIINVTLENTENSVNAINQGNRSITEEQQKFSALRNHFNSIIENSKMVASSIESIATSAQQQSAQSQEINATIKGVSGLIDSTSESTSNLNATVEEQSAMLQELNATAEKLHSMAQELNETVKVFRTEEE